MDEEGKSDAVPIGHERVSDWSDGLAHAAFLYTSPFAATSSITMLNASKVLYAFPTTSDRRCGQSRVMGARRVMQVSSVDWSRAEGMDNRNILTFRTRCSPIHSEMKVLACRSGSRSLYATDTYRAL
jgi:hypothetical protein